MRFKFLLKIALSYVKAELFDYLIDLANEQQEVVKNGVIELQKFIEAVPIDVWLSLRKEESKQFFLHLLSEHDTALLKATYFILVEIISTKYDLKQFLESYHDLLNELSISLIEIITNEESKDDNEIAILINKKKMEIINASISFIFETTKPFLTEAQIQQQYAVLSGTRTIVNKALNLLNK